MRILILGASSYAGQAIGETLAENHDTSISAQLD